MYQVNWLWDEFVYKWACKWDVLILGSTASTGSESDCQSLHAGVCAKARDIPTTDCNIAREALEILITCLQIRCELIGRN